MASEVIQESFKVARKSFKTTLNFPDLLEVRNGGTSKNLTIDSPEISKPMIYLFDEISKHLLYIGNEAIDNLDDDTVSKFTGLLNTFIGLCNQIQQLSKHLNSTSEYSSHLANISKHLSDLVPKMQKGNDENGYARALDQIRMYNVEKKLAALNLDEVIDAKNLYEKESQETKRIKEQGETDNSIQALETLNALFVSNYDRYSYITWEIRRLGIKQRSLIFSIVIVICLIRFSFVNAEKLETVFSASGFSLLSFLQFIPSILIITIGFLSLSFCIKEYKKADTMAIFSKNQEMMTEFFTYIIAKDWGDSKKDIQEQIIQKTVDNLFNIPESVYSVQYDGPIHEKVIEKIIDKMPTGK